MSDRFKFRAWNNELESYGYFNLGGKPRWDSVTKGNKTYHYSGLDCADTVEQCTGLKDKNNQLIFEGDIVLSPMEYVAQHEEIIVFDTDTASFWWGGFCISRAIDNGCEITGNIHDA